MLAQCRKCKRNARHKGVDLMNAPSKCARPACNCIPADGKKYCSEVCADAKAVTELTCQCQHPQCHGEKLKP